MSTPTYLKNVVTLELDQGLCVGCGTCRTVCPQAVFGLDNGSGRSSIVDRDACMECGACSMNCVVGAVTVTTGVGCAAAVINAALGRTGAECCCIED